MLPDRRPPDIQRAMTVPANASLLTPATHMGSNHGRLAPNLRRQHERPGGLHRASWRISRALALPTVEYAANSDILPRSLSNAQGGHEASIPGGAARLAHDDVPAGPTFRAHAVRQPLAMLIGASDVLVAHGVHVTRQQHRWPDLPAI